MARKKTTDALAILHARYVRGNAEAEAELERARERLRVSMQLQEMREREGLTQQEVADRAGTSRSVIARLEQPDYEQHTLSTLRKVAGAMGYDVELDFRKSSAPPARRQNVRIVARHAVVGRASAGVRHKSASRASAKKSSRGPKRKGKTGRK